MFGGFWLLFLVGTVFAPVIFWNQFFGQNLGCVQAQATHLSWPAGSGPRGGGEAPLSLEIGTFCGWDKEHARGGGGAPRRCLSFEDRKLRRTLHGPVWQGRDG